MKGAPVVRTVLAFCEAFFTETVDEASDVARGEPELPTKLTHGEAAIVTATEAYQSFVGGESQAASLFELATERPRNHVVSLRKEASDHNAVIVDNGRTTISHG
jgi:hypothetical protein